jgi:prepilin-type N-terminal cleavage/methylation domain-containing protein
MIEAPASTRRNARRRARTVAFTLLEMMMSIAVFAMVMSAIYASWTSVLRSARVGNQAAAEAQRARVASRALETALSSVVMFMANHSLYRFEADTSGEFAALSFVARLPGSFPGSGYYGDQIVRRVAFVVEPGTDSLNELRLIQFPILSGEVSDEQLHPLTIARDVSLFMLEFSDGKSGEWMDEWTMTNRLPAMVRFALAFGRKDDGSNTPRELVVRSVLLPTRGVLPTFQGMVGGTGAMGRGQPGTPGVPGPEAEGPAAGLEDIRAEGGGP